jgi:hypothetical protein
MSFERARIPETDDVAVAAALKKRYVPLFFSSSASRKSRIVFPRSDQRVVLDHERERVVSLARHFVLSR